MPSRRRSRERDPRPEQEALPFATAGLSPSESSLHAPLSLANAAAERPTQPSTCDPSSFPSAADRILQPSLGLSLQGAVVPSTVRITVEALRHAHKILTRLEARAASASGAATGPGESRGPHDPGG